MQQPNRSFGHTAKDAHCVTRWPPEPSTLHAHVGATQDLDQFTPVPSEVDALVAALAQALRTQAAHVEVDRRGPGFFRLTVDTVNGRQVAVRIAHDARLRASVQLDFRPVLLPDEVAADETLAPFGRAAARDLVDVTALTNCYPLQHLCALAKETDPGFDPRVLADAMSAAAAHPDDALAELGLSEDAISKLRSKAQEPRAALLAANTENPNRPSPSTPTAAASATSSPDTGVEYAARESALVLPEYQGRDVGDVIAFSQRTESAEILFSRADPEQVARGWEAIGNALQSHATAGGVYLDGAAWLVQAQAVSP